MDESQVYSLKVASGELGNRDLSLISFHAIDDEAARQKAFGVVDNRPEYDGAGLYRRDGDSGVDVYLGPVVR